MLFIRQTFTQCQVISDDHRLIITMVIIIKVIRLGTKVRVRVRVVVRVRDYNRGGGDT